MVYALALLSAAIVVSAPPGPRRRTHSSTAKPSFLIPALVTLFFLATLLFIVVDAYTMIAGIIIAAVLLWYLRSRHDIAQHVKQSEVLASFLSLCAGNLRAGVAMVDAMEYALANSPTDKTISVALQTAARQARSGGSGPKVLIDATSPDLQRLGYLWDTSSRHGIPLVALIDQMRLRITAKQRHAESTRAALQGPQATAVILTVLPLAGVLMGTAMGAHPLGVLTGGGIGGLLLVIGVGLDAAGFVITHKILQSASPQ
ncbi:type II secretion system protein F [Corynebacterium suranareeae]|uniref:Type II secretion system protein F n=1 Tax=Corynebacterium suranareeae TaxID=2506452 RepID=A0A160PPV3_9CORY|nr:type II secretion system F family protein [Corynebacterium suranareeae]BAU94691.1 type II secretion system protein F [Corynebacterium suranareeae]